MNQQTAILFKCDTEVWTINHQPKSCVAWETGFRKVPPPKSGLKVQAVPFCATWAKSKLPRNRKGNKANNKGREGQQTGGRDKTETITKPKLKLNPCLKKNIMCVLYAKQLLLEVQLLLDSNPHRQLLFDAVWNLTQLANSFGKPPRGLSGRDPYFHRTSGWTPESVCDM